MRILESENLLACVVGINVIQGMISLLSTLSKEAS